MDAEAPRRLALAQPLDVAGVASPSVELHREHPRLPRLVPHEVEEGTVAVQSCTATAGLSGRRLSGTLCQCRSHAPMSGRLSCHLRPRTLVFLGPAPKIAVT